ncbi:MAG TPA: TetR/AcrR family transcriptional regulator [Chthoniobacterales bacterium]|nr:TetR/AcrR family transcriptional regulator [Chthoniobacterales bacterium]
MKAKQTSRQGRPRLFDEAEALEKAMEIFWRHGYDAASISELTTAMGINPPSLYAAFGNKEELFLRVLDHYGTGPCAYSARAVQEVTAYEVARQRLYGAVEAMCDTSRPPGCLAVQATVKCGDPDSVIGQKLAAWLEVGHQRFVDRFRRAQEEGDLAQDVDPVALTRFINAVAHGIAVSAVTGVSRSELEAIADLALQQIPERPSKVTSLNGRP